MKSNRLFKVLPVAATLATLGLGVAGDAHAYAYAFSDLSLTNGTITVIPTGTTAITGFGACVATGCANFLTPASASTASASLGGSGTSTNDLKDALPAVGTGSVFPGGAPVNNAFALKGPSTTVKYSWGDSQVISEQTLGAPPVLGTGAPNFATKISTRQMAEGNTIDPTLGTSNGNTSSQTEFLTDLFTTGAGARVRFDFDLTFNRLAAITLPNTGLQALGSGAITITITNVASGLTVFNWNVGGAATGAATSSNGFALSNASLNTTGSTGLISNSGSFSAVSNDLAQGQYRLSLSVLANEAVQANAVIPEPATLGMLGLGLGMLGFLGRRRRMI